MGNFPFKLYVCFHKFIQLTIKSNYKKYSYVPWLSQGSLGRNLYSLLRLHIFPGTGNLQVQCCGKGDARATEWSTGTPGWDPHSGPNEGSQTKARRETRLGEQVS